MKSLNRMDQVQDEKKLMLYNTQKDNWSKTKRKYIEETNIDGRLEGETNREIGLNEDRGLNQEATIS